MPRVQSWAGATPLRRSTETGPARFEPGGKFKTGVKEASDVVGLPNGAFVVVGDRSDRITLVGANGKPKQIELPGLKNGQSQLEGVAYDPERHHLFVSREESREVLRYEWNPDSDKPPKLEKTIELPKGKRSNKGFEGIAYLSTDLSPTGKAQMLVAREGAPRQLSMLGDGGGGKLADVKLEKEVYAVCRDFSAVAVDPKTGNVFLSSDESSTVAQVRLVRDGDVVRGKLVQSFPLRTGKDKALERVEGLTFNGKGDLFVLTENDGELRQLNRR